MNQKTDLGALLSKAFSFDFYHSPKFWLAFIVVVVVIRLAKRDSNWARWTMLGTNLLMLLALPRLSFAGVGFLFLLACIVFGIGKVLMSSRAEQLGKRQNWIAGGAVGLVLVVLMLFKYRFVQDLVIGHRGMLSLTGGDYLFLVGISYTSFRMIHFIIEARKRTLEHLEFVVFMNYVFFFPSFISGPINRYGDFSDQWHTPANAPMADDFRKGFFRIVQGMFKTIVLSVLVAPYSLPQVVASANPTLLRVLLGLYASTLNMYFNFSGYSDIAVGAARMMGIELPENFDKPYVRSNIQQFWAAWHISLTNWLTDYFYWPLVRKLRPLAFLQKRPVLLSNICIVVTFAICGMWHGVSLNFILWGLYHGLGIALMNVYRKYKRKVKNHVLRDYFISRTSRILGVLVTINFFVLGIALFSLDIAGIRLLLSSL